MTQDLYKIGTDFLDELANTVKCRTQTITYGELCECYDMFSEKLKSLRSTSANFTGLGELLIFRLILGYLESYYKAPFSDPQDYPNTQLKCFKLESKEILLGQCLPIGSGKHAKRPDITIWENTNNLLRAIEIKIYLSNGLAELKLTIEQMTKLHNTYPKFKGLLFIFTRANKTNRNSTILNEINALNKLNGDWLRIEVLSDYRKKLFSEIASEFCTGL